LYDSVAYTLNTAEHLIRSLDADLRAGEIAPADGIARLEQLSAAAKSVGERVYFRDLIKALTEGKTGKLFRPSEKYAEVLEELVRYVRMLRGMKKMLDEEDKFLAASKKGGDWG
jgi:hypothetical protein